MAEERPKASPTNPDADRSVGELVLDVSERTSILVREEIELAKTEVTEKVSSLARGAGVGVAAGVFVLVAFVMILHAIAWGINDLLGVETSIWAGFLIEAAVWLVVAAVAGLIARRTLRKSSPPTPEMAIEEAKRTREALEGQE